MSVVQFPGGGAKKEEIKLASEALREFADLMEELEISYGDIEVAGCALVPELGVVLCGNSATGRDGMMTMLEIGKTAIVMEYLNGEDDYDGPTTLH